MYKVVSSIIKYPKFNRYFPLLQVRLNIYASMQIISIDDDQFRNFTSF